MTYSQFFILTTSMFVRLSYLLIISAALRSAMVCASLVRSPHPLTVTCSWTSTTLLLLQIAIVLDLRSTRSEIPQPKSCIMVPSALWVVLQFGINSLSVKFPPCSTAYRRILIALSLEDLNLMIFQKPAGLRPNVVIIWPRSSVEHLIYFPIFCIIYWFNHPYRAGLLLIFLA